MNVIYVKRGLQNCHICLVASVIVFSLSKRNYYLDYPKNSSVGIVTWLWASWVVNQGWILSRSKSVSSSSSLCVDQLYGPPASSPLGSRTFDLILKVVKGMKMTTHLHLVIVLRMHVRWVPVTTAWRVLRLRMEERPPIWRIAANKLNKQSRTADEGWSSSLGVGRGANNASP